MSPTIFYALFTVLATAPSSDVIQASGSAFIEEGKKVCREDARQLCRGVFPGGGRIEQCLSSQIASVSPNCQSFLSKANQARHSFTMCEIDIQVHCSGVEPGEGRVAQCLSSKRNVISPGCASALSEIEATLRQ